MPLSIEHFMWGYQGHFRVGQECVAKRIFCTLDPRFAPEVFLVGILAEEDKSAYPACVDPESDFWAHSDLFNSALRRADDIRAEYPERNLIQSHHLAQKWQDDALQRRSIRDAIQQIIEASPNKPAELVYFVAHPARVESYLVSVVLGLQARILHQYPFLRGDSVPIHEYRSMRVATSLIDAVISVYLDKASSELRLPDPGCDLMSDLNAEDIIRDGAKDLMTGMVRRAEQNFLISGTDFFNSCSKISRMNYEGIAGTGELILGGKSHAALEPVVRFVTSAKLGTTKAARKLLQMASQDLALHTDSENIHGLVRINPDVKGSENLFTVRFLGHNHWEVLYEHQALMRVKHDQPRLPIPSFDEGKTRSDLRRIFGLEAQIEEDLLLKLIHIAEKEKHGTMLLISEAAKEESERLAKQSTPIEPMSLTEKILRCFTSIDGAVLLDPQGICYATGVILDGKACEEGDPARGARFNSAIRYVNTSPHRNMAVIVSEDGGVCFIPNLKPMIRRSQIDKAILRLKSCLEEPLSSRRRYNQVMEWLEEHRFYLLPQHCQEINQLVAAIEQKIASKDTAQLRVVRSEFFPNPGLDTVLYYEIE